MTHLALALWLAVAQDVAADTPQPQPSSAEERARLAKILQWPAACEADHQADADPEGPDDGRVRLFELQERRYLVQVGCARGAYQDALRFYLFEDDVSAPRGTALVLASYDLAVDDDDQPIWTPVEREEAAGVASYDATSGTLRLLTLYRGLGDCGHLASYILKGKRLELRELRGRDCDGDPEKAPPPESWPRVFPE